MTLEKQLVVTSLDNPSILSFHCPLKTPDKVALKSIHFPKFQVTMKFGLYILDDNQRFHELQLKTFGLPFRNTEDIMDVIFNALHDFCTNNYLDLPFYLYLPNYSKETFYIISVPKML